MQNDESKYLNETINQLNFKILEHGHLNTGQEWFLKDLSSPFNRLYFVMSGNGYIKSNIEKISLRNNHLYIIPHSLPCDYVCETNLHMFYVHFRLELVNGDDIFSKHASIFTQLITRKDLVHIFELANSPNLKNFICLKGLFLFHIGNCFSSKTLMLKRTLPIAKKHIELNSYIQNNLSAKLRIKDIANFFHTKPANLSRNFKNDTGISLKQYIDEKIIEKAQTMLLLTDKSIKKIAFELKFTDEFYFSRFFKKHTNLSPSVYRKRTNTHK